MSTPAQKGFATPTGTDLISQGDNAITQNAVAAVALYDELKSESWFQGRAANGTNWNTHRKPGVLMVYSNASAATMIGLPEVGPGFMETYQNDEGSTIIAGQRYTMHISGTVYERPSANSTEYSPWEVTSSDIGDVAASGTLAAVKIIAAVKAPNHTTISDMPPGAGPGIVFSVNSKTFTVMRGQLYFEYAGTHPGRLFYRVSNTFTTFGAWVDLGGGGGGTPALENPHANAQLKQWFIRRRGGFIGTGEMASVAVRADHGAVNFKSIMLPILRRLMIPCGFGINPGPARLALPENSGVTWSEYRQWANAYGVEPWNHSMGHVQALSTAEFQQEIVNSLELLKTSFPDSAIEGWMPPGVGANGYGGQSSTDASDSFYGYEAGRIILAHHAVSAGYGGGKIRPQMGTLVDGQAHFGLDSATTADAAKAAVRRAQETGGAVQFFIHPSVINRDSTYTTTAVMTEILEFIAAERDAGRLEVLTPSGLMLADSSHTNRHNLIRYGDFRNSVSGLNWITSEAWGNRAGYTRQGESATGYNLTTTTGSPLTQVIEVDQLNNCRGAVYELVADFKSVGGAIVRLGTTEIPAALTPNGVIPATDTWVPIRQFITIPMASTAPLTVSIGRVSGADLQIRNIRLQPV